MKSQDKPDKNIFQTKIRNLRTSKSKSRKVTSNTSENYPVKKYDKENETRENEKKIANISQLHATTPNRKRKILNKTRHNINRQTKPNHVYNKCRCTNRPHTQNKYTEKMEKYHAISNRIKTNMKTNKIIK